jgi:predicted lactoylglutathione lyase
MTKRLWINLPVKDIKRSRVFFAKMGFSIAARFSEEDDIAGVTVGEKNMVMLVKEARFRKFSGQDIADTTQVAEILISIDAESRAEVEEMAQKARDAGGHVFAEPEEIEGWMYGCAFADLDGHRWNVLYMDMSKMPKQ